MNLGRLLKERHRFPAPVNRLIDFGVDHPPRFLWRRLSPLARPAVPEEIPDAPRPPGDARERVLIGPVNYSGQGTAWARALEKHRAGCWVHAFAIEVPGGYSFDTDTEVPLHVHASSREWQDAQLAALSRCTHVLVEAERPLLGRRFRDFEAEAIELRGRGLDVAFLAHGTDVRIPSQHLGLTRWSHFADSDFYAGREETLARRNIAALRRLGGPLFVSTPDLLAFLPEAQWCPVIVDPRRWFVRAADATRTRPVVMHAPTNARVKGTDLIEPVLHRLEAEGVIEYRPLRGVPSAKMPAAYAEADIVLDQFRIGSYGVAACETMAAGRVVIGHLTDEVRDTVKRETGIECPVVEADPDTLETVLRRLAADPAERAALAAAGREFVARVHDGTMSAEVLGEHWLDLPAPQLRGAGASEPEVDVVIATHTPQRPVERAVSSVVNGSRAHVRATVVVHNTDPGPIRAALAGYIHDPRVRIVEYVDGVPSPTGPMNYGLSLATAPYTSLLGSDDEIAQGAIDAWLEAARRHRAGAVIARIDFAGGGSAPQPPVRPRYRERCDPVRDRLAYRSAPLGLISMEHFGELRLTPGLVTGEDIAYSARVWFSGAPILFPRRVRGYVGHIDGDDHISQVLRPVRAELGFVDPLLAEPWFGALGAAQREALVVKLLRVQFLGFAGTWAERLRGAPDTDADPGNALTAEDRRELGRLRMRLVAAAPRAERRLSRAELELLDAVCNAEAATTEIVAAGNRWRRRFTPAGVLTRNLFDLLHRQAPLRYGIASLRLARELRRTAR